VPANVAINQLSGNQQFGTEPGQNRLDYAPQATMSIEIVSVVIYWHSRHYLEWALSAERINNLKLLTITDNQLVYK